MPWSGLASPSLRVALLRPRERSCASAWRPFRCRYSADTAQIQRKRHDGATNTVVDNRNRLVVQREHGRSARRKYLVATATRFIRLAERLIAAATCPRERVLASRTPHRKTKNPLTAARPQIAQLRRAEKLVGSTKLPLVARKSSLATPDLARAPHRRRVSDMHKGALKATLPDGSTQWAQPRTGIAYPHAGFAIALSTSRSRAQDRVSKECLLVQIREDQEHSARRVQWVTEHVSNPVVERTSAWVTHRRKGRASMSHRPAL